MPIKRLRKVKDSLKQQEREVSLLLLRSHPSDSNAVSVKASIIQQNAETMTVHTVARNEQNKNAYVSTV